MKFFTGLFLSGLSFCALAQSGFHYSTSNYVSPVAQTIDMSAEVIDFDPRLLLIKPAAPQPLTENRQLKNLLDQQRLLATHKSSPSNRMTKTVVPEPTLLRNFNGNLTQGTPNDNDLAISNGGFIVSVVNANLNIYNDTGKYILGRSLAAFATSLGSLNRTYDPRVIYDPKEDRFVLVFLQGSTSVDTRIIVAFSQTNDPTQKWNFYTIPGNVTSDSTWSDYPILSLSNDELFITVNRVKDNTPWQQGFVTSYIWQCDKKAGYTAQPINQKIYNNITYNGKSVWNICPVKGGSTLYGPNMFFVSQRPSDLLNDTVFLHEITNTAVSGMATFTQKIIRTNVAYGLQPNAIQPNGKKLQTNDARMLSAMYENGYIHYVGNTIDTTLFVPAVYYGIMSDVFGPTPAISGKIISYDSMDIGYPSISYIGGGSGDNSTLITFSHVSPTLFPGTSAVITDRFGNVSAPVFVKKGDNNITVLSDSVNRWGDYSGNQRKYNELGVCWINGSYGNTNGDNRTWIAKLKSNDPLLGVSEQPKMISRSSIYPNPASEYVQVSFTIEQTTYVDFELWDMKGNRVAPLLHDKAKAGTNRFSFTTEDLASGIYLLTIKDNQHVLLQQKIVVSH
ncbi:MAG: T9SS type A sorting domain-containing protein [Bacteroidota bacterium]